MQKIFIVLLLFITSTSVWGQATDSSALEKTARLVYQMDSMKRADSLRRLSLQNEIEQLKGSSKNRQREVLEQQLAEIEKADSIKKEKRRQQLTSLKSSAHGFAVAPFGDTLLMVFTRTGSFSAKDRAMSISAKIEKLYDDVEFSPDSLSIYVSETSTEIVYHDIMVMSVNEMEALWFDRSQFDLAVSYQKIIQQAIREERSKNSYLNIAIRIGAIILIILGIYFVIRVINVLFVRLRRKIISSKGKYIKGIRFRGYQFLDSKRVLQLVLFGTNAVRLLIILLSLYIALPLLFSVFPWTRGIAETLIGWILTPLKSVFGGLINYLPNLFTIIVIGTVTHFVIKFLKFVTGEIADGALTIPGFYPDWARPTFNIVRFLVFAFSFIIIFPYLPGSDSPIFQGVSVFLGVLFSLGSSSAISNAVAGLVITYMRPFKVGDRIKIGELSGEVIEKSLLVTRIRTIKNENITIPNSTILAGHTINYTTSANELGLILHTSVTIGYDVPWKQVHGLLMDAAKATDGVLHDEQHQSFVLQTSLDDFYVAYQINVYSNQASKMAKIYSDLHQNIQDKFNEGGVEILSPHYRAARDGNTTTIPSNYLPKDYQPPSFNVSVKKDNNSTQ